MTGSERATDPSQDKVACAPLTRRRFFLTISKLLSWGVPLGEALSIAASSCKDQRLSNQTGKLVTCIRQGQTLVDAMSNSATYWGHRTIEVIRRYGEEDIGQASRRIAAGAGEPSLQRPLISCLNVGCNQWLVIGSALVVAAGLCLPILPYTREDNGRIRVLAGAEGTITNIYAPLSINNPERLSPEFPQSFNATRILRANKQEHKCIQHAAAKLAFIASELDRDRMLTSLQPSPVPIIWLERWLVVETLLRPMATTGQLGMGKKAIDQLIQRCPHLGFDLGHTQKNDLR